MGKINVLSFEIANLIAAGEVVERPSSVLKELLENSIDAGATEIVAEIKRGGVALIRVTDNGCGIEKEDLPVSLKRHATSKIREKEDLSAIMTLGFRGEALAAISSVSEVTIITRTKNADIGYMLTSEGGKVLDISEVGASEGTTVVVENLFFNVPARRKFLKKDATEAMNVAALVEKVALSRPDISIQLLIDGEEKFKTPGDSELINTIRSIYGRDFASKMIKAEGDADGIKVSGYVGRSDNVRKNRNLENVFINGRYVKSLTAQAAVEKAYTSFIATEHFPACVLFISMNPGTVDVNVHPAKLEVKFSDERRVFEAVYYTVKRALEESEYRPEITLGAKKSEYNPANAFVPIEREKSQQLSITSTASEQRPANDNYSIGNYSSYRTDVAKIDTAMSKKYDIDNPVSVSNVQPALSHKKEAYTGAVYPSMTPKESVDLLSRYKKTSELAHIESAYEIKPSDVASQMKEYKIIGEAFDCYVMVEFKGELLIIDKHAAHERIIFEELNKNRKSDGYVASQSLMLPITVMLTPDEISSARDFNEDFRNVGFEFSENGLSVDITAIPNSISPSEAEGMFVEILGDILSGQGTASNTEEIRREKALYTIACKAAIKGGRIYDSATIDWIVMKVLELPDITVCPHGRPIAYKLKKSELDRQFERIK